VATRQRARNAAGWLWTELIGGYWEDAPALQEANWPPRCGVQLADQQAAPQQVGQHRPGDLGELHDAQQLADTDRTAGEFE
jgi:hypothetical protein